MAVTNMSIIEKDDLIKKMPRDALKEELRNPSGNFPLFLVAARLKEVEEMERDMMARQAAQQSSQEGESVAARLAQQAMPQSPMSGVGANPAPQPRPDPQGVMAQQMAGPNKPLPTVYREDGGFGLGALGGLAMPETYKSLSDTFGRGIKYLGLAPFLASKFYEDRDEGDVPQAAMAPQEVAQSQERMGNTPVVVREGGTMPTVYAQSGLRGKYPGQASGIDQEILAAAVRSRQAKGAPRLYNQERKAGFEKAGRKGAAPASQIPALLGLASALAKTEERAYGGMETLPPFQVESSTMPMSAKGFAARARSVGSRMPEEEDGLAYISKVLKSMGGSSDDKPTVFAQSGFGGQPDMGFDPILRRNLETFGLTDQQFSRLDPKSQRQIMEAGERYADPSPYQRDTGIPYTRREAIRGTLERAQQQNPYDLVARIGSYFSPESAGAAKRAEGEAFNQRMAELRNILQPPAPAASPGGAAKAAPPERKDGSAVPKPAGGGPPVPVKLSNQPAGGAPNQITDIGGVPTGDFVESAEGGDKPPAAADSPYDVGAILKSLQDGAEPEEVGSVNEYLTQAEKLIPDLSPERKQVIKDYEEQLASVQKRDPVPKSLTDIRDRMRKRLDDLENSPLPFMTAAAAAIKGNQPILVAMTNAMIGYTAGDEKVKNQGLKIMGDIVDTDVKIEGLKSKQMELETTARNALMKARQEDIEGRDKRARELLTLANNNRNAAQRLSVENAKLEQQRLGQISNFVGATLKTVEEKNRYNTLVGALMEDEGMSRSDAMIRAYTAIRGGTTSTSAETLRLRYDQAAQKFMEDKYRNLQIRYNTSEAGKANPSDTGQAGYDPKVIAWAESQGALPTNEGVRSAIGRIFAQNKGAGAGGGKTPAPPKGFTVNTK